MEKNKNNTMADVLCSVRTRKAKNTFLEQVDTLIDWTPIVKIIERYYTKVKSAIGRPAYTGLSLIKMSLLQTWYGMSDYEAEERINDSISFGRFCGFSVEETAPDHSTLSRFRSLLTKHNAYDEILNEINRQLEEKQILVRTGAIVDASIVDSPLKPKTKPGFQIAEDRAEEERDSIEIEKEICEHKYLKVHVQGVDSEAAWIKKGKKSRYGYKKHVIANSDEGLVLGVLTTPANVNEICNLEDVLEKVQLPEETPFYADKGYMSKKNQDIINKRNLINCIMYKAVKNRPLTDRKKELNKLWGATRYKVERIFGSVKRWFGGGMARYKGIAKTHSQNVLEGIAYNLYRSPGIVISKAIL